MTTDLTDALDTLKKGFEDKIEDRFDRWEAEQKASLTGRTDRPLTADFSIDGLLSKGQKFTDAIKREPGDEGGAERVGAMLHAMATKATGHLSDLESKAVSGVSSADGGILVPEGVAASVIDLARVKARTLEAGAQVMPMTERHMIIPKLTAGSEAGWRSEAAPIAEGDPDIGYVRMTANSLACLVKISWEIIEDSSPDVWAMVADDLTAQLALKLDYAALKGSGVGSEPLGITNTPGVNTLTATGTPTSYDKILDAMAALEAHNHEANAWLLNSRDSLTFRKLKTGISGDKSSLVPPPDVTRLNRLVTNQLPSDEGAGDNESSQIVGSFKEIVLGVRPSLAIRLVKLTETFAATGQYGLIAFFRGDVAVRHPEAFTVLSGVTAS